MARTRIKICGIREHEHAHHAVACGADALGFVFYEPSPRAVTISAAAKIISMLPSFVTSVGLFVDAGRTFVAEAVEVAGLNCLQFHGSETPEYCESFNMPYMKAVRVKSKDCIEVAAAAYSSAQALLLDAYVEGLHGGTGSAFDWHVIPANLREKVVVAGGLTPNNVSSLIKDVSPYAVDVSGGVEREKGFKDNQLISAFIRAVQEADGEKLAV